MQLEEDQKAFLPLLAYFWNLQNTLAKATKLYPKTIVTFTMEQSQET
jgi:hypothetical protein